MKLTDLRRRLAAAIEPPPPPSSLEPLDAQPLPPLPGESQPLTPDQRANLEALRDRYAPDRQNHP